ncbi:MAG: hypothetical protein M3R65_08270 [Gemmatimonadota bacterium]|nr:hypothetical protein [Gemmatimonadota bacterium]
MIFRGRARHVTVWQRFRSGHDGFTFAESPEGHFEAHVAANAERAVDLMYVLSEHLPPAVDVHLVDQRTKSAWDATDVALPDVRDVIARLKIPLATYAGVDLSIYTPDDQLSLTAELDLYAYGRSDRWLYLLQARGLEQYRAVAHRAWRGQPWDRTPAPVLTTAIASAVERLGLVVTA